MIKRSLIILLFMLVFSSSIVAQPGITNIDTGETFTTIQAAIDDADTLDGHTINIPAGTYNEDLRLTKGVTLRGANAGIDPNTGTRGAETIIHPGTNQVGTYIPHLIIDSDDITINGITLDGNFLNETGMMNYDGAAYTGPYDNTVFLNNIMREYIYSGLWLDGGTSGSSGHLISNNYFENMPDSVAASFFRRNAYGVMEDNVAVNTNLGFRADFFNVARIGNPAIRNNTVIGASNRGIWYNAFGGPTAGGFDISGNTIIGPGERGINITSISTIPPTINNNVIINVVRGYDIWNIVSAPMTISGGQIVNSQVGVFYADTTTRPNIGSAYYGTSNANNVTLSNLEIIGSTQYGILFHDSWNNEPDEALGTQRNLTLNVDNVVIRNGAIGIRVEPDTASADFENTIYPMNPANTPGNTLDLNVVDSFILSNSGDGVSIGNGITTTLDGTFEMEVQDSCIVGNGTGYRLDGTGEADARNNWWGAASGADSAGADTTAGNVNATSPLVISPDPICNVTFPIAVDDATTTQQDTSITNFNIIANDTGIVPSTITILNVSSGSAISNGDGTINYTPPGGFIGTVAVTYQGQNAGGQTSNVATILITVTPSQPQPPIDPPPPPTVTITDPAVSKLGLLIQDDLIEWVITVSNPGTSPYTNLQITDDIPAGLLPERVEGDGTAAINGQNVTVGFDLLMPGESAQFSIFTRVVDGIVIQNTACAQAENTGQVCITGLLVNVLPATGESQR